MRDHIQPFDLRRARAQSLTASIMQEISPLLEDNIRDVREAIYALLWRSGVDLITDATRKEAGLPDRGNLGYTREELHILELKRQEVMLTPLHGPACLLHPANNS